MNPCFLAKRTNFKSTLDVRSSNSCSWVDKEFFHALFFFIQSIKPKEMLDFSHGRILKFTYKGRSMIVKKAYREMLD